MRKNNSNRNHHQLKAQRDSAFVKFTRNGELKRMARAKRGKVNERIH